MSYTLISENSIMIERILTNYGKGMLPVTQINVVLTSMAPTCSNACNSSASYGNIPAPGFTMNMTQVGLIFDNIVSSQWNMRCLVQCGQPLVGATMPVVYVDFSPSIENIAYNVFMMLKGVMYEQINAVIDSVEVIDPMGMAVYTNI